MVDLTELSEKSDLYVKTCVSVHCSSEIKWRQMHGLNDDEHKTGIPYVSYWIVLSV